MRIDTRLEMAISFHELPECPSSDPDTNNGKHCRQEVRVQCQHGSRGLAAPSVSALIRRSRNQNFDNSNMAKIVTCDEAFTESTSTSW